jgi:hypothetical protein
MSGGQPGSKLIVYERYPAPVFTSLHWRAEGATQKCCSIKGTSKLLRLRHKLRPALYSDPASPSEDLSSIARELAAPPMMVFPIRIELALDVPVRRTEAEIAGHDVARKIVDGLHVRRPSVRLASPVRPMVNRRYCDKFN